MNSSITHSPMAMPLPFDRPVLPAGQRPRLAGVGAWVRQALAAAGAARARGHLLAFADRCEASQPELAKELRSTSNQMSMG